MRYTPLYYLFIFICITIFPPLCPAQEDSPDPLKVGVKESPPFVIKNADGSLSGISIELWTRMANEIVVQYEWVEKDLEELFDGIKDGSLDIAVGALTITPEREEIVNFTHSFYSSGLGIVAPNDQNWHWITFIQRLFSLEFLSVIAFLFFVLMIVGYLVWYFERRHNPDQFGGTTIEGIFSGLWWSAVTMTTVGYGDKTPVTLGGRIIALIWMFAAIIAISSITAAITSSLTISQLDSTIKNADDLRTARVGTLPGSTSYEYLRGVRARIRTFENIDEGFRSLQAGSIEAFVYDAPILKYVLKTNPDYNLQILPFTLEPQDYGFAFPNESPLREKANIALLQIKESESWDFYIQQVIGD